MSNIDMRDLDIVFEMVEQEKITPFEATLKLLDTKGKIDFSYLVTIFEVKKLDNGMYHIHMDDLSERWADDRVGDVTELEHWINMYDFFEK